MRIGVAGYWFNRGQGTMNRHLRSLLEGLGHETFVLARPAKEDFERPAIVGEGDVWGQDRVTRASGFDIAEREYVEWCATNGLEAVFFNQDYQFDQIAALRGRGVRTMGYFVWESFQPDHAAGARRAYDAIFAVSRCQREHYAAMGIEARAVRWGCHPELIDVPAPPPRERPTFFYPAGYLSKRKPTAAVVEAFRRAAIPDAQLIIKAQRPLRRSDLVLPRTRADLNVARRDPSGDQEVDARSLGSDDQIVVLADDLPTADYFRLFASCQVSLAPSRWEGTGLHLFEATAFGIPTVCNDMPPLNEVIRHGQNGLLTSSRSIGELKTGIPVMEPDVDDLARALRTAIEPASHASLVKGTLERRAELDWRFTAEDVASLLAA